MLYIKISTIVYNVLYRAVFNRLVFAYKLKR